MPTTQKTLSVPKLHAIRLDTQYPGCVGVLLFVLVKCGEADVVVAGATEASIQPWVLAAFGRIRALSLAGVSRPFDVARDGFVMAEGAGALVLEAWTPPTSQEKLLRPPPIAEILGFGRSGGFTIPY